MKILVLADVHANWQALQAIDESFDACLVLGDLVDYGGDPAPCVEWVKQHATCVIRGNHDHAVAQRVAARGGSGFRELVVATRPLQWQQLSYSQLQFLGQLPVTQMVELDGLRIFLVHATPRDPMDEYLLNDAAAWRTRLQALEADFVCVGHTHVQFLLELEGTKVLNPGSVGQPRDGDPRAAYAVIEDGNVSFRRVAYDIPASIKQMERAGASTWAVETTSHVLNSGGRLPDVALG